MKKLISFIFLIIISVIAVGCSDEKDKNKNPASVETEEEPSVVKLGWQDSGFPSPFAFSAAGPGGFLRQTYLFDSLTWKDEDGIIPWLAKEWEVSDDGLTYTFSLEEDVTFHDGESMTADDVVFSYTYFKEHGFPWNADVDYVNHVEKLDDYTVQIELTEAYAPFLSEIAGILPIIPEHVWETVDDPVQYHEEDAVVGTGPFILIEYDETSGNYLYRANDSFFKGEVSVDEVQYLNVSNRMLSLQNQEIDAGITNNYTDVTQMKEQGYSVMRSDPTGSAVRIVFNMEHDQLRDKHLRQAIAYALDREYIAEKVLGGGDVPNGSAGVIPPDSPWYNENVMSYEHDVRKANDLLDDLGYEKNSDGIREELNLNIIVSSNEDDAQLMQEMLKNIGINLNIQQLDPASFATALGENQYDIALTAHIGLSGDPDFLRLWFSGEVANEVAARGRAFEHDRFHELAKQQASTMDQQERQVLIDEMQNILAEELPTLILYHRPFYFIYDESVYDGWINTYGGIADGIPHGDNKVGFIDRDE